MTFRLLKVWVMWLELAHFERLLWVTCWTRGVHAASAHCHCDVVYRTFKCSKSRPLRSQTMCDTLSQDTASQAANTNKACIMGLTLHYKFRMVEFVYHRLCVITAAAQQMWINVFSAAVCTPLVQSRRILFMWCHTFERHCSATCSHCRFSMSKRI